MFYHVSVFPVINNFLAFCCKNVCLGNNPVFKLTDTIQF